MAGSNVLVEEKPGGQQLDKQVQQIYNPDTDGKIYNPARHGAAIYRTTPVKNPLPLGDQINKYIKLKVLQAAIYLVGFLVMITLLYLGRIWRNNIHHLVTHTLVTVLFLFRGVFATISTVLLYRGNKKEDIKLLKNFLTIGRLSYSWFDYYAGGYNVIKRRIMEIMSKQAKDCAKVQA